MIISTDCGLSSNSPPTRGEKATYGASRAEALGGHERRDPASVQRRISPSDGVDRVLGQYAVRRRPVRRWHVVPCWLLVRVEDEASITIRASNRRFWFRYGRAKVSTVFVATIETYCVPFASYVSGLETMGRLCVYKNSCSPLRASKA